MYVYIYITTTVYIYTYIYILIPIFCGSKSPAAKIDSRPKIVGNDSVVRELAFTGEYVYF